MEEIADRAKVSKPIVYEHFGGKEGLYAVIVDREVEHIVARIGAAVADGLAARAPRSGGARLSHLRRRAPDGFAVLLRDAPRSAAAACRP